MFRKTGIPLLVSGLLLGATLPGNSPYGRPCPSRQRLPREQPQPYHP